MVTTPNSVGVLGRKLARGGDALLPMSPKREALSEQKSLAGCPPPASLGQKQSERDDERNCTVDDDLEAMQEEIDGNDDALASCEKEAGQ